MDGAADQHALAARGRANGHQRRLGGRRAAVVVRGGDDVQAGQLRDQRLVLVDRLERALADLRLVGRIRGIELAARQDLVDRRRDVVAVRAGAEEARQADAVARGQLLEPAARATARGRRRQVEAVGANRGRDVGEERVDRVDAQRGEHLLAIGAVCGP